MLVLNLAAEYKITNGNRYTKLFACSDKYSILIGPINISKLTIKIFGDRKKSVSILKRNLCKKEHMKE
jgi:hypothetical protein